MSILFDQIIFGPVRSRRFGISLGINLLPSGYKFCTFDCVYCECGWTRMKDKQREKLFTRDEILTALEKKCRELSAASVIPDNLTFAGNGEPTLHPEFPGIMEGALKIRNSYFPGTQITVLSNATQLHKPAIKNALLKADNNVLKLDCGTERMFRLINRPLGSITLDKIVRQLIRFKGNLIIQSLFIRGEYMGESIDNTTSEEISAWLEHLQDIQPRTVMIYSIDRKPPVGTILKVPKDELYRIAGIVEDAGIRTEVYP
jgi:wyosine [tRNA(Phe)-imidazoG37] synthetase (radical SAM superfamily)